MATPRRTQSSPKASHPRRGEIYLTALDPTLGREIQKTRPALIVQNDVSNRLSEITIVAPITSTVRFPLNPVHVLLVADEHTGLAVTSVALFNQIRAVDRVRLTRRLGAVDRETLERVDEAIKISLGLIRLDSG
jgi:mRNA interferase MazF